VHAIGTTPISFVQAAVEQVVDLMGSKMGEA